MKDDGEGAKAFTKRKGSQTNRTAQAAQGKASHQSAIQGLTVNRLTGT